MNFKSVIQCFVLTVIIYGFFSGNTYTYSQDDVTSKILMQEHELQKENDHLANDLKIIDHEMFQYNKAWKVRSNNNSILSDVKEIDIPIIGGRVRSVLVDESRDIFLAAPSGGGLWRFAPDGSFFAPIDDFGSFMSVTHIEQNPHNPDEIFISTGDEFHFTRGNGLFRSSDRGTVFVKITSTDPNEFPEFNRIRFIRVNPVREGEMYLSNTDKLYRSTDDGNNWTMVYDGVRKITSIDFTRDGSVIISEDEVGLSKSTHGSINTFEPLMNGIPYGEQSQISLDNCIVAAFDGDRDIVYALITRPLETAKCGLGGDIYKSLDGGESWNYVAEADFCINAAWFVLTLGVHPTNSDILIAGSITDANSIDGGKTWRLGSNHEVDFHAVYFDKSDPQKAYIGYDQGIGFYDFDKSSSYNISNNGNFYTEDGPFTYEIGKNSGFNTSQIYFGDYYPSEYGDALIYGQQDGGSFAKVDNFLRRVLVGDGGSIFVHNQDPNKVIGSTQNGNIFKNEDALKFSTNSWKTINRFRNNHPNFITQFAQNDLDGDQVYIASSDGLDRTIDFANSFETILEYGNTIRSVFVTSSFDIDPNVFVGGRILEDNRFSGFLSVTKHAATNPQSTTYLNFGSIINSTQAISNIQASYHDSGVAYAIWGRQGYRLDDFNEDNFQYEHITEDIEDVPINVIIDNPIDNNYLLAGTDIGLFSSEDGGRTWLLEPGIPFTQIKDLKYRKDDGRLFVFTHGRGAFAATIMDKTTAVYSHDNAIDISVHPNPTTSRLNIDIEGEVSFIIYDDSGRRVTSGSDKAIETNSLNGTYVIHIYQREILVGVEKIIVVK